MANAHDQYDRIGDFSVDESGYLVRRCEPRSGKNYEHRCHRNALEEVAQVIDELAGAPFTYEYIHQLANQKSSDGVPHTQVAVAIAFLKERGIILPIRGRKHIANGDAVHLDVMIEYHALREGPQPEANAAISAEPDVDS